MGEEVMGWIYPKSEYVGTVTAISKTVDDDGNFVRGGEMRGRWVLTFHPWWGRKAKFFGYLGTSPAAQDAKARVEAWRSGGPLPPLDDDTRRKTADVRPFKIIDGDASA